ncbi:hypothetical protein C1Y40_04779 [Mycobacterium talmoniae]|uniref:DUF3097 domain-containing protein n=1 Tax=Mycobacterium talmoniae TaxID=1858794 RepID=A0A2S8BEG9_9MYCO|nr:hypothetical protein C1Y40_04779 [Mycobacterium talmoniae]
MPDRYGSDVLANNPHHARKVRSTEMPVEIGMVVEDAQSGYVGAVVRVEYGRMDLEDRNGRTRGFPVGPGYLIDGKPVILTAPRRAAPKAPDPHRVGFGGGAQGPRPHRAGQPHLRGGPPRRRTRRAGVGGRTCGLRGVVVEYLGGVDDLAGIVAEFRPGPGRRLGVLVDHLVAGSKESRIADAVRRGPGGAHTLVVGHPFIDIWAAVKPERIGRQAWPTVPRGVEWKHGVCEALGWKHANQADIAKAWQRIRGRVRDWNDLEPALIGRVEELIDFVTQD